MKFISKTVIDDNTVEIPCGSFEIAMKKADLFAAPSVTFSEWRVRDMGTTPLIHGHTHSATKYSLSDMGTPQLHVGLDAWGLELVHEKHVHDWVREVLGL